MDIREISAEKLLANLQRTMGTHETRAFPYFNQPLPRPPPSRVPPPPAGAVPSYFPSLQQPSGQSLYQADPDVLFSDLLLAARELASQGKDPMEAALAVPELRNFARMYLATRENEQEEERRTLLVEYTKLAARKSAIEETRTQEQGLLAQLRGLAGRGDPVAREQRSGVATRIEQVRDRQRLSHVRPGDAWEDDDKDQLRAARDALAALGVSTRELEPHAHLLHEINIAYTPTSTLVADRRARELQRQKRESGVSEHGDERQEAFQLAQEMQGRTGDVAASVGGMTAHSSREMKFQRETGNDPETIPFQRRAMELGLPYLPAQLARGSVANQAMLESGGRYRGPLPKGWTLPMMNAAIDELVAFSRQAKEPGWTASGGERAGLSYGEQATIVAKRPSVDPPLLFDFPVYQRWYNQLSGNLDSAIRELSSGGKSGGEKGAGLIEKITSLRQQMRDFRGAFPYRFPDAKPDMRTDSVLERVERPEDLFEVNRPGVYTSWLSDHIKKQVFKQADVTTLSNIPAVPPFGDVVRAQRQLFTPTATGQFRHTPTPAYGGMTMFRRQPVLGPPMGTRGLSPELAQYFGLEQGMNAPELLSADDLAREAYRRFRERDESVPSGLVSVSEDAGRVGHSAAYRPYHGEARSDLVRTLPRIGPEVEFDPYTRKDRLEVAFADPGYLEEIFPGEDMGPIVHQAFGDTEGLVRKILSLEMGLPDIRYPRDDAASWLEKKIAKKASYGDLEGDELRTYTDYLKRTPTYQHLASRYETANPTTYQRVGRQEVLDYHLDPLIREKGWDPERNTGEILAATSEIEKKVLGPLGLRYAETAWLSSNPLTGQPYRVGTPGARVGDEEGPTNKWLISQIYRRGFAGTKEVPLDERDQLLQGTMIPGTPRYLTPGGNYNRLGNAAHFAMGIHNWVERLTTGEKALTVGGQTGNVHGLLAHFAQSMVPDEVAMGRRGRDPVAEMIGHATPGLRPGEDLPPDLRDKTPGSRQQIASLDTAIRDMLTRGTWAKDQIQQNDWYHIIEGLSDKQQIGTSEHLAANKDRIVEYLDPTTAGGVATLGEKAPLMRRVISDYLKAGWGTFEYDPSNYWLQQDKLDQEIAGGPYSSLFQNELSTIHEVHDPEKPGETISVSQVNMPALINFGQTTINSYKPDDQAKIRSLIQRKVAAGWLGMRRDQKSRTSLAELYAARQTVMEKDPERWKALAHRKQLENLRDIIPSERDRQEMGVAMHLAYQVANNIERTGWTKEEVRAQSKSLFDVTDPERARGLLVALEQARLGWQKGLPVGVVGTEELNRRMAGEKEGSYRYDPPIMGMPEAGGMPYYTVQRAVSWDMIGPLVTKILEAQPGGAAMIPYARQRVGPGVFVDEITKMTVASRAAMEEWEKNLSEADRKSLETPIAQSHRLTDSDQLALIQTTSPPPMLHDNKHKGAASYRLGPAWHGIPTLPGYDPDKSLDDQQNLRALHQVAIRQRLGEHLSLQATGSLHPDLRGFFHLYGFQHPEGAEVNAGRFTREQIDAALPTRGDRSPFGRDVHGTVLNPEQAEAFQGVWGNRLNMIAASAGTGKTHLATGIVAEFLHREHAAGTLDDLGYQSVIATSYTNVAAEQLHRRIQKALPMAIAGPMLGKKLPGSGRGYEFGRTLDSLALQMFTAGRDPKWTREWTERGNAKLWKQKDQEAWVKGRLGNDWIAGYSNTNDVKRRYKSALDEIQLARSRNVSPEQYLTDTQDYILPKEDRPKVGAVYEAMLQEMNRTRQVDFLAMEKNALKRMLGANPEDARFKKLFKGRTKLALVDEIQDMTPLQLQLIGQMLSPEGTMVGLGDYRQRLYGWRGAATEQQMWEAFGDKPAYGDISLNLRSDAAIVKAAGLVAHRPEVAASPLIGTVKLHTMYSEPEEQQKVAEEIAKRYDALKQGGELGKLLEPQTKIAALAFQNRFLYSEPGEGKVRPTGLAEELTKRGVKWRMRRRRDRQDDDYIGEERDPAVPHVILSDVEQVKGDEFGTVFSMGWREDQLFHPQDAPAEYLKGGEPNPAWPRFGEEVQNKAYTAISRAMHELHLSYSGHSSAVTRGDPASRFFLALRGAGFDYTNHHLDRQQASQALPEPGFFELIEQGRRHQASLKDLREHHGNQNEIEDLRARILGINSTLNAKFKDQWQAYQKTRKLATGGELVAGRVPVEFFATPGERVMVGNKRDPRMDFLVPGKGGVDSQHVSFPALPGEHVTVGMPGRDDWRFANGGEFSVPKGHTRLYRGGAFPGSLSDQLRKSALMDDILTRRRRGIPPRDRPTGRWFSADSRESPENYWRYLADEKDAVTLAVDVPDLVAARSHVSRENPDVVRYATHAAGQDEYILPVPWALRAVPVGYHPDSPHRGKPLPVTWAADERGIHEGPVGPDRVPYPRWDQRLNDWLPGDSHFRPYDYAERTGEIFGIGDKSLFETDPELAWRFRAKSGVRFPPKGYRHGGQFLAGYANGGEITARPAPSSEQQEIIEFMMQPGARAMVEAIAGAGKTTLASHVIHALHDPEMMRGAGQTSLLADDILALAFNVSAAQNIVRGAKITDTAPLGTERDLLVNRPQAKVGSTLDAIATQIAYGGTDPRSRKRIVQDREQMDAMYQAMIDERIIDYDNVRTPQQLSGRQRREYYDAAEDFMRYATFSKHHLRTVAHAKATGQDTPGEWKESRALRVRMYEAYENVLARKNSTDHAGVMFDARVNLQDPRNPWIGKKKALLIDEAQDLNLAHIDVANKILHPDGRLMIVGDEMQSIYQSLMGAIGDLGEIAGRLGIPESGFKHMTKTFRLTPQLARWASAISARRSPAGLFLPEVSGRTDLPEFAARTAGINERRVDEEEDAVALAARRAAWLIRSGVPAHQIGILAPDSGILTGMNQALVRQGVRHFGWLGQKARISMTEDESVPYNETREAIEGGKYKDAGGQLLQNAEERELGRYGVTLRTISSSKGQQFDHVILLNAHEGMLPHINVGEDPRRMAEAGRLFYVGNTRAGLGLDIIHSKRNAMHLKNEPSHFLGMAQENYRKLGRGEDIQGFFNTGGDFTIPGSGGIDSTKVSFMGTPGERVRIIPRFENGGQLNADDFDWGEASPMWSANDEDAAQVRRSNRAAADAERARRRAARGARPPPATPADQNVPDPAGDATAGPTRAIPVELTQRNMQDLANWIEQTRDATYADLAGQRGAYPAGPPAGYLGNDEVPAEIQAAIRRVDAYREGNATLSDDDMHAILRYSGNPESTSGTVTSAPPESADETAETGGRLAGPRSSAPTGRTARQGGGGSGGRGGSREESPGNWAARSGRSLRSMAYETRNLGEILTQDEAQDFGTATKVDEASLRYLSSLGLLGGADRTQHQAFLKQAMTVPGAGLLGGSGVNPALAGLDVQEIAAGQAQASERLQLRQIGLDEASVNKLSLAIATPVLQFGQIAEKLYGMDPRQAETAVYSTRANFGQLSQDIVDAQNGQTDKLVKGYSETAGILNTMLQRGVSPDLMSETMRYVGPISSKVGLTEGYMGNILSNLGMSDYQQRQMGQTVQQVTEAVVAPTQPQAYQWRRLGGLISATPEEQAQFGGVPSLPQAEWFIQGQNLTASMVGLVGQLAELPINKQLATAEFARAGTGLQIAGVEQATREIQLGYQKELLPLQQGYETQQLTYQGNELGRQTESLEFAKKFNLAMFGNPQGSPVAYAQAEVAGLGVKENQAVAGRSSTLAGLALEPIAQTGANYGLKGEEFMAGQQHSREQLLYGRSNLSTGAAFQSNMQYLDKQKSFFEQEAELQKEQRDLDIRHASDALAEQKALHASLEKIKPLTQKEAQDLLGQQAQLVPLQLEELNWQKTLRGLQNQTVPGTENMGPGGGGTPFYLYQYQIAQKQLVAQKQALDTQTQVHAGSEPVSGQELMQRLGIVDEKGNVDETKALPFLKKSFAGMTDVQQMIELRNLGVAPETANQMYDLLQRGDLIAQGKAFGTRTPEQVRSERELGPAAGAPPVDPGDIMAQFKAIVDGKFATGANAILSTSENLKQWAQGLNILQIIADKASVDMALYDLASNSIGHAADNFGAAVGEFAKATTPWLYGASLLLSTFGFLKGVGAIGGTAAGAAKAAGGVVDAGIATGSAGTVALAPLAAAVLGIIAGLVTPSSSGPQDPAAVEAQRQKDEQAYRNLTNPPALPPNASSPGQLGAPIANQFDYLNSHQLTMEEAAAACGPVAALAFVNRYGRSPTVEEAMAIAKNPDVGWTSQRGMPSTGAEMKLLSNLGINATYTAGATDAMLQQDVANGSPTIISTPNHYFVADKYDPKTGKYYVGGSGQAMAREGGSDWMSLQDIQNVGGGYYGAITEETGQGQTGPHAQALKKLGLQHTVSQTKATSEGRNYNFKIEITVNGTISPAEKAAIKTETADAILAELEKYDEHD